MSFLVINRKRFKLLVSVVVLAIFVVTTSGYALATVPGNKFSVLLILPIMLWLTVILSKNSPGYLKLNLANSVFFTLFIITLVSFVANTNISYFTTTIKFIFVISFAFLFTSNVRFESFIRYYINTLKTIVIISLVGFILMNIVQLPVDLPVFENVNGVQYYNALVYFPIKSFGVYSGVGIPRNIGCFWEPGVFSTFIILAIALEILFKKSPSKLNILIFVLGLLSTRSTFGYLLLPLLLLLYIFRNTNYRGNFFIYLFTLGLFVFVVMFYEKIILELYELNPSMFGKLLQGTSSVTERIESPITNLKIFVRYPIFGAGVGKTEILYGSMTHAAQTSTTTYFLAAFGFFGLIPVLSLIIGILRFKFNNININIIFLIIVLLQINKEPHIYFSVTFILMFYFLKKRSISIPDENPSAVY